MTRKLKNILMLVLVILLIGTSCITIYFAKGSNNSNNEIMTQNNGGTPPEIPSNSNSGMEEPPAMPSGEMPNNSNMEEPPEKPDGENDTNLRASNPSEPPEKPSGSNNNRMMNPQDGGSMQHMNNESENSSFSIIYYVLFVIQSLGISLILMYLLLSSFNKKTVKETFVSSEKLIIYIISVAILTGGLTFAESYIAKNVSLNSSRDQMLQNGMGGNNSNISYKGAYEITEETKISSGEYTSSAVDENAILVSGEIDTTIENITIEKTGDSDGGDNTSFYGINSALLAKSGANLTLKNLTIITNAVGANGIFSYGGTATTNNASSDGTTITVSDSKITTKKDNSGGIMTTGGGTTNAYDLTINTAGVSSAAIRTDRGGGIVNVAGGNYTTTGSGSPSIYSTAEINVKNATLISKVAEGIVIEGKNSVVIDNCNLTDSNTKLNGLSTTYKNIFLYQSMSGDADEGTSSFTANNSKIITNNGDTFYITNTAATINLNNNTFVNNDSNGNFLRAQADSWGNKGSNGGDVKLILTNQKASGNIVIDSISKLDMTIKSNSYYEGTINSDNSAKSITLKLDKTSKIKLTENSYITSLDNADANNSNIDFNGYKLYVNGESIN